MTPNEIKSQDDLKKYLAEAETAREVEKTAAAKTVEEVKAEMEKARKEAKDATDKLQEAINSKNWTEKYSTMQAGTKEETLYRMGKYIQGMVTKNPGTLKEFGKGGQHLSADQEKQFGQGEYSMQKADLGTPIYSDATSGSYLVPVEYMAEVMYVAKQASQMMGQVREIPMQAITKYFPIQNAAAAFKWQTTQASAKSEVNPTFTQGTLTSKTGAMWTGIADELLEDSLVPMAAYFRDIFGEAWGYEFDYQATQSNANPFTGILQGAGNVMTLGNGQTSFSDVKFDDLYDAVAKLTTVNKREGGKWIMHCTVFDILRKIKDANGQYIYQQPYGTQPGTICGYPYIITDGMIPASSSTVSTKFIAFGNPKYMFWGNRVGLEFKIFDQTAYAVEWDEILFRCRVRCAFTVGITGAFVAIRTAGA